MGRLRLFFALSLFFGFQASHLRADTASENYRSGLSKYNESRWNDAVLDLDEAVKQDPGFWEAYQMLGYCYHRLGDDKKSIENCKKSLELHPGNPALKKFVKDLDRPEPPPPFIDDSTAPPPKTGANLLPEHENSLYLNIGYAMPYDPVDFKAGWNGGFSFGAGVGFGLSRIFSLVLDANYNSFPINSTAFTGYTVIGGNLSDTLLAINGKFRFIPQDNPVIPYGIVGLGMGLYTAQSVTLTSGSSSLHGTGLNTTNFAFRLGLGIDIRLSGKIALFIESNGVSTSTSLTGITYNMVRAGLKTNL